MDSIEQIARRDFLRLAGIASIIAHPLKVDAIPRVREPKPRMLQPDSSFETIPYLSPYNQRRPIRPGTRYIILHTTEAGDQSSISSVHARGTANFVVDTSGKVYNTIDMDKIAKHAGRSMWQGKGNISNISVGIEVVGYHDKDITLGQYDSLKDLISKMKQRYSLTDNQVLTHSMVAYGSPNRFHDRKHRGRKRCGMLFATSEVREKLGLKSKPARDPDVAAGRLVVADKFLEGVLYGKPTPAEVAKAPQPIEPQMPNYDTASEIEGFVEIGPDKPTAYSIAGRDFNARTTIYFLPPPNKLVRMGDEISNMSTADGEKLVDRLPSGTKVLIGYVYGGKISPDKSLFRIAGKRWNYPSTFYRLPGGEIKSGDEMQAGKIPKGTIVLFRS